MVPIKWTTFNGVKNKIITSHAIFKELFCGGTCTGIYGLSQQAKLPTWLQTFLGCHMDATPPFTPWPDVDARMTPRKFNSSLVIHDSAVWIHLWRQHQLPDGCLSPLQSCGGVDSLPLLWPFAQKELRPNQIKDLWRTLKRLQHADQQPRRTSTPRLAWQNPTYGASTQFWTSAPALDATTPTLDTGFQYFVLYVVQDE